MARIPINTSKTTEAISLLLKLHQKPTILSKLLKMMYFIDRLSLYQTNCSLTNDSYLGKKSGLIPKHIPKLISKLQDNNILSTPLDSQGYIILQRYSGIKELGASDVKNITSIYQQKKDINPFNLLDWNYDLEFIKNHVKAKRTILITPVDIMFNLGKTAAEVRAYRDCEASRGHCEAAENHSESLSVA